MRAVDAVRCRIMVGLLALIGTACAAAPAAAQVELGEWNAGAGPVMELYSFGDAEASGIETLSLTSFPFAGTVQVRPGLEVTVSGAFARGSLSTPAGESHSTTGLTDTGIRAAWNWQDRVRFTGTIYVPTGATGFTLDEARVAGATSSLLLPFRVKAWGVGGGFDMSAAWARQVGDGFGIGARLGYRMTSEYQPISADAGDDPFDYDPGNQVYLRVAADKNMGAGKATFSVTYQQFGDDAAAGQDVLSTGDRVQLLGSYVFPWAGWGSAYGYGGLMRRGEGEFLLSSDLNPTAKQTLLLLGGGARLPWGESLLRPGVDLRVLNTADGVSQGYTVGIGGQAEVPYRALDLVPTVRIRLGNLVVREGQESGFAGFELGLTVRGGGNR